MILSHKYRFIFIKTGKTAGTSLEIALSRFCGSDDIITPVSPEDEEKRLAMGGSGPRNYLASPWQYTPSDWIKNALRGKPVLRFYNHMPAKQIKDRVGKNIWNSYFKFCIERNPWDRVISQYYWHHRRLNESEMPSILEFLESRHMSSIIRKKFYRYRLDGEVAVDRICRFENLSEDLEEVRQHLGLPAPLELPKTKAGTRKNRRHYRDILSAQERDRIAEIFSDEIELMGYTF